MSGGAPRGSPLRHRSSRRGPRAGGGVAGVARGGPVPPGKMQLLERFFTPPGPPPGTPSSSPSVTSCSCSSSSSGGGEGPCGGPHPRSPRGDPRRDPLGFGDPLGTLGDPRGSRLRRGLSRSHEGLHPGDPPAGTLGDIPDPLGDILGTLGDVAASPRVAPDPLGAHGRRGPRRGRPRGGDPPEGVGGDGVGTLGDTPDPLGDPLGTFGAIAGAPGSRLRRGLSRSHEGLHPGDPPGGLGDPAGTLGDSAGGAKGGPHSQQHPPPPRRRGGPSQLRLPGGLGDSAGSLEPLGDIEGTFGDPPMSPRGGGGGPTPRPSTPPRRRGPGRGVGGLPEEGAGAARGGVGGLRREQSRSQEGLGVARGGGGARGGGPPRRSRSLEAVGAPRGGSRFSRFLDELTRRVLSPAELRALGWPPRTPATPRTPPGTPRTPPEDPRTPPGTPRTPGPPRAPEARWGSGSPPRRVPGSPPRRVPGSPRLRSGPPPPQGGGQGPPGEGMEEEEEEEEEEDEEEEEEEEEEGGQEPGGSGGAAGPRGAPPARAELDALRERMDRLQVDYANSQRLNRLLEERLTGLAQAMALERAALSRHVAEVLQRVLGGPPGPETPPRDTGGSWGRAEAEEEEEEGEGPLLPPPAFRDPPRGAQP